MSYYRQNPYRPSGSGFSMGFPPVTPVNKAIMIACGAVWVVQFLSYSALGGDVLSSWLGLVPARVAQGWIWQLGTYLFLHDPVQPFHILFNMLLLWMMGGDLERHWGPKRYLTYYLVCGIGAGVFVTLTGLWSEGMGARYPTIGASGAIYGIILAFGIVYAERMVLFMLVFPMRARTLSWILFALAFLSNWSSRGRGGISHIAHLGGMVVGYLYLKRAWRVGEFAREIRWRIRRRRFRIMDRNDDDRWIH